ncbi:MAG: hypothetical protein KC583_19515, partial [Myxococcales bacterium]|nr:hypothetical protein [Myxococcales bacterium]
RPLAAGPDRREVRSGYVQQDKCVGTDPISGRCTDTARVAVRETKTVGNAVKSEAEAEIRRLEAEKALLEAQR